ncbi:MbtH family NRPS accessory protein [Micromonospora aurantiaca]|uniref:MbtH family protein n=1 Tax=Micromonospora aurantiaca (nom. illeg.) TaxID=47850 RepID=UPI0033A5B172
MSNPFDVQIGSTFGVLVNGEGQYSLWPARLAIPCGWVAVLTDQDPDTCAAFIEGRWTDLRPASLRDRMNSSGG